MLGLGVNSATVVDSYSADVAGYGELSYWEHGCKMWFISVGYPNSNSPDAAFIFVCIALGLGTGIMGLLLVILDLFKVRCLDASDWCMPATAIVHLLCCCLLSSTKHCTRVTSIPHAMKI